MDKIADRTAWFKGGESLCSNIPSVQCRPPRLVLLGAPGSGKGTQADLLCALLGACHLSTGDVFRAAKRLHEGESDPELEKALAYMRRGELVPDEIVLELVRQRGKCMRCAGGFILDGFPRTVDQAAALQKILETNHLDLTAAVHYELSSEQVIARLSGRRVCPACKSSFHIDLRPSQHEGVCDHCGARLVQREDDKPESIRVRMTAHAASIAPLLEFYRKQGLLVSILAVGSPSEICQRTIEALPEPTLAPSAAILAAYPDP